MFVELEFRLGFGLDIQSTSQELETAVFQDEDGKDEEGMLHFEGLQILLPFMRLRIGEATAIV